MVVKESQEFDTTQPGTPKRGMGVNGSGERSSIEAGPRIFTANTINMDRRKRKVYTSGRPSISQGVNTMRVPNIPETSSIASMTQTWMHANDKFEKQSIKNS
jgi:hypothetical protein